MRRRGCRQKGTAINKLPMFLIETRMRPTRGFPRTGVDVLQLL